MAPSACFMFVHLIGNLLRSLAPHPTTPADVLMCGSRVHLIKAQLIWSQWYIDRSPEMVNQLHGE